MSEEFKSEEKGLEFLNQLEYILEHDPLLDEVGFIHPSQFDTLNAVSVSEASKYDSGVFWHKDHKLGISTKTLLPLYKAAKRTFFSAYTQYKNDTLKGEVALSSVHEMEVMRHSRALLLLSSDFGTVWNSRKLIVSKKQHLSMLMDELQLSALVLSYSPKSDHAWSHRRWVIKMIAGKCSELLEIVEKESELVKRIAERYKMNYRSWNHRCWLVSYMIGEQLLVELKNSRDWAGLHVADNSCFHYRAQLLLRVIKDVNVSDNQDQNASFYCSPDIYQIWKEELDWNEMLIKRYVGREALWLHRRFLSLYWIKMLMGNFGDVSCHLEETTSISCEIDNFIDNELQLLESFSLLDNDFEDVQAQVTFSLIYVLWLMKQLSDAELFKFQEKLRGSDLKSKLNAACPEKAFLWDHLVGEWLRS